MQRPGRASQERTGLQRSGQGPEPHRRCCKAGEGEPLGPRKLSLQGARLLLHEAQDPHPPSRPSPALTQVSHPLSSSSAPGTSGEVRGVAKLQDSALLPKGPGHSSRDWGRTQEEASARGSCLSLADGELRHQGLGKAVPEQGDEGLGAYRERPWVQGLSAGLWVTGRGVSPRSHASGGAGCPQKKRKRESTPDHTGPSVVETAWPLAPAVLKPHGEQTPTLAPSVPAALAPLAAFTSATSLPPACVGSARSCSRDMVWTPPPTPHTGYKGPRRQPCRGICPPHGITA